MVMEFEGKHVRFAPGLWVQHGGVTTLESGERIVLEGVNDDSYLKVFNHFGRVLKVFTFENGRWIDADTGYEAKGLDEAQAGHLPRPGESAAAAPATMGGRAGRRGTKAPAAGGASKKARKAPPVAAAIQPKGSSRSAKPPAGQKRGDKSAGSTGRSSASRRAGRSSGSGDPRSQARRSGR